MYRLVDETPTVAVSTIAGVTSQFRGDSLDEETSAALFERRGSIAMIEVGIPDSAITVM